MTVRTKKEKVQFWWKWTLRNAIALVVGYIIAFSIAVAITIIGDLNTSEWGPPFTQTCWKIGEGVIIGLSIGFIQLRLLRKIFNVSSFWLYSIVIGFIIVELIAGITCWRMEINRGDLSFLEGDPLGHTLMLTLAGLMIGIIQFPLLRKHFSRAAYWVLSSAVAWGLSVLLTAIDTGSEIGVLLFFILGTLLYGSITGATLMWLLVPKEIKN